MKRSNENYKFYKAHQNRLKKFIWLTRFLIHVSVILVLFLMANFQNLVLGGIWGRPKYRLWLPQNARDLSPAASSGVCFQKTTPQTNRFAQHLKQIWIFRISRILIFRIVRRFWMILAPGTPNIESGMKICTFWWSESSGGWFWIHFMISFPTRKFSLGQLFVETTIQNAS